MARVPEDFMFELSQQEYETLRSQFGTLKRGEHAKYLPFAFTEQGVAMLSGILNSPRAIDTNIAIMRTFVALRRWMESNKELAAKIRQLEKKYDQRFKIVFTRNYCLLNILNTQHSIFNTQQTMSDAAYDAILRSTPITDYLTTDYRLTE